MALTENLLGEDINPFNDNQLANNNNICQLRLSFLNSSQKAITFTEVTGIAAHLESDLSGWYGIESLIGRDTSGKTYDIDIRHAWTDKVFQQNLIDYGWTESILLSSPVKLNRSKLIIYLCEDTIQIPSENIFQPTPKEFLITGYWQEVIHLYLKKLDSYPFNLAIGSLNSFDSSVAEKQSKSKSGDSRPLISIITVVKNGEKYIEQTIQSVINQTYSNIEYVIVDGGSTDRTLDIVKKYENEISYWISEPDEGISDAFNKGVSYSHGFLIGILSADDLYFQASVIEKIFTQFEITPSSSFYFGDCLYDSKGSICKVKGDNEYARKLSFFMPHIHHPTVLMKREVLVKIPFSTSYKLSMDYHLFLRLSKQGLTGNKYDGIITIIRNCGVSNRFYYQTRKEVFKASTEQGTSILLAGFIYIILVIKYWIKNA